jgi:hypothetical protein
MILPEQPPSIFESFNARFLNPDQVARTFIPPSHYEIALKRAHSLIVGPRGSGKTTILKMLQAPALEAWKHASADHYRAKIDFTGVFVPTDRSWSIQLNDSDGAKLDAQHQRLFAVAAFTTHFLRALVDAMQYRAHPPDSIVLVPHRRVNFSRSAEAHLVSELGRQWSLEIPLPSLLALKHALRARLGDIWRLRSQENERDSSGRGTRLAAVSHLHLNFLLCAGSSVEMFDDLTDSPKGHWAFLFDELELAPQWIRQELIKSLRSVNEQFLFKLSMSPYSRDANLLHDAFSATVGNDYDQIALWYAHKENGYGFCKALFEAMLREHGLPHLEPSKLFGESEFETSQDEYSPSRSAYGPDSRLQRRFILMSQNDASFRVYLKSLGINPRKLHLLGDHERAAAVRKVTSLIAVREAFRTPDEAENRIKRRKRTRKNPALYRGATSLFAMVEGNPRWFIGIVGNLIQSYAREQKRIIPPKQGAVVMEVVNQFRAYLRTIPCSPVDSTKQPVGVLSVLNTIGEYFHDEVVRKDFNPDPQLTFIVDSRTDDYLMRSLGDALNAGAIVYVNEIGSELILQSLRGKRFRLSYLLAPHYGIPIILGRGISLATIMGNKGRNKRQLTEREVTESNE